MSALDHLTFTLMAKLPRPGAVKTRLTPALGPEAAAAVHRAMLACTLARLERLARRTGARCILAVDDQPESARRELAPINLDQWRILPQAEGDLGDRIVRIWQTQPEHPMALFGVDSPDLPRHALEQIPLRLRPRAVLLGPVDDGGYWTLAADRLYPELFRNIDWGTASVYHQTLNAAHRLELLPEDLHPWFDVDLPADLHALRQRLSQQPGDDPDLQRLHTELDSLCKDC